jgi:hypothetical protein
MRTALWLVASLIWLAPPAYLLVLAVHACRAVAAS